MKTTKLRLDRSALQLETREEAYAPISKQLEAFSQHKTTLIDRLHGAYQRGPKSRPFNREKSWHDLLILARLYFWGELSKQNTTPPAERFNRLRQLSNAVHHARDLAASAICEDIGIDLLRGWVKVSRPSLSSALSAPEKVIDEISEISRALAKLGAAASAAASANTSSSDRGRPSILPYDCIHGLARIYRTSTGSKPGRGRGPFARFVSAFVAALNGPNVRFDDDSLVGAIQEAHRRYRPSMFEK